jgi:hypothetical protein
LFSFGELPETPPEKNFKADPDPSAELDMEDDETYDNYEDLDFDENWN